MRAASLVTSLLIVPLFSCMNDPDVEVAVDSASYTPLCLRESSAAADPEVLPWDVIQHTCALYVAIRSAAFETPLEFGRDVDDSMVHWNKCPGGNMVACAVVPTAHGDSIVGIPFPYE